MQAQTWIERNKEQLSGYVFELISMALFAYGIVCSRGSDALIALSFFGALALCAPFSGGHINPAVTLAMLLTKQVTPLTAILYWKAQLIGAFLGGFACYMILGEINSPMVTDLNLHWIIADFAGETLGTFTFILVILIQCNHQTTFSTQPLAGVIVIALALHFSRCYTYHSGGCLNPGMALALEFFQILKTGETQRFKSVWVFVAGPFLGSIIAVIFYKCLYTPLLLKYQKK